MSRLEAKVFFVGAGPGDPELITVKGQRILQQADVILYADSLVSKELIDQSDPEAVLYKSSSMDLEQIVGLMTAQVRRGKSVARVHTGDPSVYGAIYEQIALLKKENIPFEIIPGVSSVFAASAALGAELTIPGLTQTLILTRTEGRTPVPEKEKLKDLAAHHTTIALFLSAALTKKAVNELIEAGWPEDTPVAAVQKATWPEQKIVRSTLKDLDQEMQQAGIRSHTMILAGWALDPDLYKREGAFRSRLYDPSFTHGYRKGESNS